MFLLKKLNKIALSSNYDKRMQSNDSIETYAYGTNKDLVSEREEKMQEYNKTIHTIINFNDIKKKNIKEHNPNQPQIHDYPYIILICGGSGSGKMNLLFNLINHQPDIDKIYLYLKHPYEIKYQFLIKKM